MTPKLMKLITAVRREKKKIWRLFSQRSSLTTPNPVMQEKKDPQKKQEPKNVGSLLSRTDSLKASSRTKTQAKTRACLTISKEDITRCMWEKS